MKKKIKRRITHLHKRTNKDQNWQRNYDSALKNKNSLIALEEELSDKLEVHYEGNQDFGGFFETALAIQPLSQIPSKTELLFKSIPRLIRMQKNDGSFGGSVAFTSIALPSMSHTSSSELNEIKCRRKPDRSGLILSYVVHDKVVSNQRSKSHFLVPKGAKLIAELRKHSEENPHTFNLTITNTLIGPSIESWNGIKNDGTLQAYWKIQKVLPLGDYKDITEHLERETVDEDTHYIISFNRKM